MCVCGHRSREKLKRSPVDLCICIFNSSGLASHGIGSLVKNGKRQVQSFVDCSCILEPGTYTVVNMAFNHWQQSQLDFFFMFLQMILFLLTLTLVVST